MHLHPATLHGMGMDGLVCVWLLIGIARAPTACLAAEHAAAIHVAGITTA
jgi:hypothetical protein